MCYNEEIKIHIFLPWCFSPSKKSETAILWLFLSRRVVFRVFRFHNEVSLCIARWCRLFVIQNYSLFYYESSGTFGLVKKSIVKTTEASYKKYVFRCHENIFNHERHFITKSQWIMQFSLYCQGFIGQLNTSPFGVCWFFFSPLFGQQNNNFDVIGSMWNRLCYWQLT